MKRLSLTLTLCLISVCAIAVPKFPVVLSVDGKVRWFDKDGKLAPLKPKQVLIEKAVIETEAKSEVSIEIDPFRKIRIFGLSRVELPAISWETGEVSAILLKQGSMRWQESKRIYNLALSSEVFEFLSPTGDFVFRYEPLTATAEVLAIVGSMEFSASNAEDVALLTSGQKVKFTGVREGDEVVYDILLKGKKIPRGKLGLVQTQSPTEKQTYSLEKEKKVAAAAAKQKSLAEQKAKAKAVDLEAICQSPSGRLDQCAWSCANNPKKEKKICRLDLPEVRCVRTRCNANGIWGEPTPSTDCAVNPNVKACDY